MHQQAYEFISRFRSDLKIKVIDIGSRDVNGTCRALFPNADYVGIDLYAGPAVDVVGNACEYTPGSLVDVVLSAECLEHAPEWQELIHAASRWLVPGGLFLMTCAGPGRDAHSHIDGQLLREGEYYANLDAMHVSVTCSRWFSNTVAIEKQFDTYAVCRK